MVDNFVCFGAKVAPLCFNRLTDAVSRMMQRKGYICQNYLDDFICYGSSYEKCVSAQLCLIKILRDLGFYINWSKLSSPSRVCRYLGLWIDSSNRTLSLPKEKMQKIRNALIEMGSKRKVKKKTYICVGYVAFCHMQAKLSGAVDTSAGGCWIT